MCSGTLTLRFASYVDNEMYSNSRKALFHHYRYNVHFCT